METKFFIGAGGSTSQKDFYISPSLICPVVNNQKLISKFLHEKNFQLNLHKNLFFDYEQWKVLNFNPKENLYKKNLSYFSLKIAF